MVCPCCFTIPSVIIKLLATASALSYGQRFLTKNSNKWVRRISFGITLIISLILVGIGLFLLVLANNNDLRSRGFANFCAMQNLKDGGPMNEVRCAILNEADISGKVLEFGPGPGTNFKCFVNSTSIDEYVGVEPNTYFKEEMMREKEKRGLTFPLDFAPLRGEDYVDVMSESFDVVILTHVLCSVDSVETVLANAERALKPGGKMIIMEHMTAGEGTKLKMFQEVVGPIFNIIGNGCKVLDMTKIIESYLGNRFSVQLDEFEAPLPAFPLLFARPHVKGVATKK
mmetsp:Transcript_1832/g.3997  ORF Transcript_1832/g.3997 Transcript_1832/m.3997 type:complete len:285 (+) Transcript_1832:81-935(+)